MRINNVVRSKKPFIFIVIFVLIFSIYNIHRTKATTLPHKTQYIILTTNNLMQSAQLIAKTRNKKYDVKIVTVEDIGSNSPSEIRNYLKKIAISKGYLLILGSENIIPRPSMYPSSTAHSVSYSAPSETKTDLYYALLNEELDKDRDLFPGELYDDRMNISPDIFVGRIPFDSNEEIKTIFNRAIQFEENPPQTAVLAASFIAYPGEIYQGARIFNGDGAREEELIATFLGENVIKLYEKSGSFPSVYKADFELTKENFYSALPNAGFVNWVAHGSNSAAYREIWNDKNENGIPDDGEFKFESFIAKDDAFKANGIFFSGSCLNENGSSNLGKAILEKGGVAFIGSTGISYSPSYFAAPHDGGTGSINYYFVKNLTAGKTVGESLYTALQEFFENDFYNNIEDPIEANLMNIYDYNLYGDPAIIWNVVEKQKECTTTKRNENPIVLHIDNTKDMKITLNIPEKTSLFILLPTGVYIKSSSVKNTIIDNAFGIMRLNNAIGEIVFSGAARGNIKGQITIRDSITTEGLLEDKTFNVVINGYDIRDINMDERVDSNDLEILLDNFGKTYMDKGFNSFSDLNSDYKTDGKDLFLFLLP